MIESFKSFHFASTCFLLLCLVRLRLCVTGRSFLANHVSRSASETESGEGRILELKPNLRRNSFQFKFNISLCKPNAFSYIYLFGFSV